MRGRGRVALAGLLGAIAACAIVPSSAGADHHLIKITQVEEGVQEAGLGDPTSEFVQVQMYSGGQNLFGPPNSVTIRIYEPDGDQLFSQAFTTDLANADNQRTALIATPSLEAAYGVQADLEISSVDRMSTAGGAVCVTSTPFSGLDCVSWGTFSGSLPSPAGTPAASWLADGLLLRSIAQGCPTLLEGGDDTNDSLADFDDVDDNQAPPRNNAATPTELPCPNTTITKTPKKRSTDRTPTFKFGSVPADPSATFKCKLDDEAFEGCDSPLTLERQPRGKHKLQVKATLDGREDPTPASYGWKIVKP